MNLEVFEIESKLHSIVNFELQEFHYQPYNFGNGVLTYRNNQQNHKFIFDGRESEFTWLVSKPNEKYSGANSSKLKTFDGLNVGEEELEKYKLQNP